MTRWLYTTTFGKLIAGRPRELANEMMGPQEAGEKKGFRGIQRSQGMKPPGFGSKPPKKKIHGVPPV